MFAGLALTMLGIGGLGVGVRLILTRPRPANLGGMVLAPVGWVALLCGLVLAFAK